MGTTTLYMTDASSSVVYTIENYPYYNGPNYQEWLLVACVIIFFLSLRTWSFFFRNPKK